MKTFRVLMVTLIAVCFIAGMASIGWGAEDKRGVGAVKPAPGQEVLKPVASPIMPAMICPPGWHQKKSTSEEFKCAPNKPAPMKCPDGWKYVEALDCQSFPGLGTQVTCSGCEVGCLKIPVIK
jgi:hypothetical protein